MVRPSGANATLLTPPPWPSSRRISRPLAASHSRAVLSVGAGEDGAAVGRERHAR